MREPGSLRPLDDRRIKGRPVLERRARGLLRAVHRYGQCRAATRDEVLWAAKWIDGLTALLAPAAVKSEPTDAGDRGASF